jgi:hypothetical protein
LQHAIYSLYCNNGTIKYPLILNAKEISHQNVAGMTAMTRLLSHKTLMHFVLGARYFQWGISIMHTNNENDYS